MRRNWLRALTGLSALLFLVLALIGSIWLSTDSGGIFDGRLAGYDVTAARTYLSELTAAQVTLYTGLFRVLDTVFPALLATALAIWFARTTRGAWRIVMFVSAAAYLGADYTENALVAGLLATGVVGITAQGVSTASLFTQVKWGVLALCLLAAGFCWLRERKESRL